MPPSTQTHLCSLSLLAWITNGYDECRDVLTCLMKEYTTVDGDTQQVCHVLKVGGTVGVL